MTKDLQESKYLPEDYNTKPPSAPVTHPPRTAYVWVAAKLHIRDDDAERYIMNGVAWLNDITESPELYNDAAIHSPALLPTIVVSGSRVRTVQAALLMIGLESCKFEPDDTGSYNGVFKQVSLLGVESVIAVHADGILKVHVASLGRLLEYANPKSY